MLAYLPNLPRRARRRDSWRDGEGPEDGAELREPVRQPGSATLRPAPISAARWCWPLRQRSTGSWCPGLNSTTGLVVLAVPAAILAIGGVRAVARKAG
jgi:hypothetical protein